MRSINKRGKIIYGDIGQIAQLLAIGMDSPNAEEFVSDGKGICEGPAACVHEGVDPGPEVERLSRGFMAFARKNFGPRALGSQIRRSGLSNDEAVAAMRAGQFDPFADVDMPQAR